jgi:hypothetical protein
MRGTPAGSNGARADDPMSSLRNLQHTQFGVLVVALYERTYCGRMIRNASRHSRSVFAGAGIPNRMFGLGSWPAATAMKSRQAAGGRRTLARSQTYGKMLRRFAKAMGISVKDFV